MNKGYFIVATLVLTAIMAMEAMAPMPIVNPQQQNKGKYIPQHTPQSSTQITPTVALQPGENMVAKGTQFTVSLQEPSGTRYSWTLKQFYNKGVVQVANPAGEIAQKPMMPGGQRTRTWTFYAIKPGTTNLVFEKGPEFNIAVGQPIQKKAYQITVE